MSQIRQKIETEDYSILLRRHKAAYSFAKKYASKKKVLDLGCYFGYGSYILAKDSQYVVAADRDKQSIGKAKEKYKRKNLEFVIADANDLPWLNKFDLVVSFQLIEHIEDVGLYLKEISKVLKKNGMLILSTPNKRLRLDDGQKPWNREHVREFNQVELKQLLKKDFTNIKLYGLYSSPDYMKIEKKRLYFRRMLAKIDILNLYNRIPSSITDFLVKKMKNLIEGIANSGITEEKFWIDDKDIDNSLDFIAICRKRPTQ